MGTHPLKTCTVCKESLHTSCYHNSKRSKDGFAYRCRDCDNKARAKYKAKHKERFKLIARKKQLKHKYGLSLKDYDDLLGEQGGCCAICKVDENTSAHGNNHTTNFSVDHDHKTGKVRGLLCNRCNRSLGLLQDKVELLESAKQYLIKAETH